VNAQTRELLDWLEREPRTYAEAVETWRTACPRLSIWEDAIADGLIEVVRNDSGSTVAVTPSGRAALEQA
jgi:hypothetical protein